MFSNFGILCHMQDTFILLTFGYAACFLYRC